MEAALAEILEAGPLAIRLADHTAVAAGQTLRLTRHEFDLLVTLARRPGAVIERDELARSAWGRPLRNGDRSIDVYVRRLRSKLAAAAPGWNFIHTHFAFGYRFEAVGGE